MERQSRKVYGYDKFQPSQLGPALFIMFLLMLLNACATSSQGKNAISIPTHGNFCGPFHPVVNDRTKLEKLIELLTNEPVDDIDAACQRHDICFELAGWGNLACNRELVYEVNAMRFDQTEEKQRMICKNLQLSIAAPGSIAFKKAKTARSGNAAADSDFDLVNNALIIAGYVDAVFNIGLDYSMNSLNKLTGFEYGPCNSDKNNIYYNPRIVAYIFDDSLIEILQYKQYIDSTRASLLRRKIGIDTRTSYDQRSGRTIIANMQRWKDHPVLSGNWKDLK